jgi:polyisoprenoid-binding protein YceI
MKKILASLCLMALTQGAHAAQAKKEVFKIVPEKTDVSWAAKKVIGGGHHGELKVKSGALQVANGNLVGGEIAIDMKSLKDLDLDSEAMNKKLVTHLNSDDFFSTAKYPVSNLKITKVEKEKDSQFKVTGALTIKGITKPVSFPATIHIAEGMAHAEATLTVDRTAYNIRFRSLKFFSTIGDKAIEDEFTVTVNLIAQK